MSIVNATDKLYYQNMIKALTNHYRAIILPIIEKYLPHVKVILYGSRARGDCQPGSDIDIALDLGSLIDESILSNILYDIEESDLPIMFDLVDFHKVSKNLQNEILKDGIVWKK